MKPITYRDWKFFLSQLKEEDLAKPVTVYDAYFKRTAPVVGFDHLSMVERMQQPGPDTPLVLIIGQDRK